MCVVLDVSIYDCDPAGLLSRYGLNSHTQKLFDRRRSGGRILALDGYPHRGRPIMLTEFGGIAFTQTPQSRTNKDWGYSVVANEDDLLKNYQKLLEVVNTTAIFSG